MKKIFLSFLLLSFTLMSPHTASAHVLKVDGSIGAVLHIDPEDDPIAGQPSNFFLEFKDKDNKFQSTNCYCRVDVLQHGNVIYSDALFQQSINKNTDTAFDTVTFPTPDVYQIQVIGKPRTINGFQSFTITYDIRVDRTTGNTTNSTQSGNWLSTHFIHLLLGVIIIFIGIFAIIKREFIDKKKPLPKGGEKKYDKENNSNIY